MPKTVKVPLSFIHFYDFDTVKDLKDSLVNLPDDAIIDLEMDKYDDCPIGLSVCKYETPEETEARFLAEKQEKQRLKEEKEYQKYLALKAKFEGEKK